MSNFIIYDQSKTKIGMLPAAESIQWLENYNSPGEVKIILYKTEEAMELLQVGCRIYNTDSDTIGRICERVIDDAENTNTMTIRAQLTAQLLDNRVVKKLLKAGNVEKAMYQVYEDNREDMPILTGTAIGYTDTADMEIIWCTVLEALEQLAEESTLGYKVVFNPETETETLKVYKGTDRTNPNGTDYVGAFAVDFGNLASIQFTEGDMAYKNYAIVAGEGEGDERTYVTAFLKAEKGENRRELYVDAKDLRWKYTVQNKDGTTSEKEYKPAQYEALLKKRGLENLTEQLKTFDIVFSVDQTNMAFGTDYFLGDRMPVMIYGMTGSAVIQAVNKIYENDEVNVMITISDFEKDGD